MGMIANEQLIPVFSQRTLENYQHVEAAFQEGEEGVYNVTQLVNSLLGLVVFPRERVFNQIPRTPLNELEGWPRIRISRGCGNLRAFCSNMRHAVAHCNIQFYGEQDIEGVIFRNRYRNRRWEHSFTVAELRQIVFKLHETLHGVAEAEDAA